ncbi:hypothetical protein AB0P36_35040 [Streptomyces flavidovirens]
MHLMSHIAATNPRVTKASAGTGYRTKAIDHGARPASTLGQPSTASVPVTFDRDIWDTSGDSDLVFLTYGSSELGSFLPAEPGDR